MVVSHDVIFNETIAESPLSLKEFVDLNIFGEKHVPEILAEINEEFDTEKQIVEQKLEISNEGLGNNEGQEEPRHEGRSLRHRPKIKTPIKYNANYTEKENYGTCSFYTLILISTVAKLRRMQIQISNIINHINKHNKRGHIYFFKVCHLEYVINYSFLLILRNLRNLCNLHIKFQVMRNFETLRETAIEKLNIE